MLFSEEFVHGVVFFSSSDAFVRINVFDSLTMMSKAFLDTLLPLEHSLQTSEFPRFEFLLNSLN